ncbi:class I SAM-dependent methyltransferase [Verrucomicrobiota bacterium]
MLEAILSCGIKKLNPILFDYGCGFGYSMSLARELGFDVYGVDIDSERLDLCRAQGLKVAHPEEFNAEYPDVRADVVLWQSNIEHLANPNTAAAFIEKICVKDTVLFVNGVTPNLITIEKRKGQFVKAHFVEHINYFPIATLDRFMAGYGFGPLKCVKVFEIKSTKDAVLYLGSYLAERILGFNASSCFKGFFERLYRYDKCK